MPLQLLRPVHSGFLHITAEVTRLDTDYVACKHLLVWPLTENVCQTPLFTKLNI